MAISLNETGSWRLFRSESTPDWVLAVDRGLLAAQHTQLVSYHSRSDLGTPDDESVAEFVDKFGRIIRDAIDSFVNHVNAAYMVSRNTEYTELVAVMFARSLLKFIVDGATMIREEELRNAQ